MHESEKWKWSRSVMSDPQWPHGLQPTRLLHPWDFPGKVLEWGAIAFSGEVIYGSKNALKKLELVCKCTPILKLIFLFSWFAVKPLQPTTFSNLSVYARFLWPRKLCITFDSLSILFSLLPFPCFSRSLYSIALAPTSVVTPHLAATSWFRW